MRRFTYFGDINAEYGGYFYCLDTYDDGYVDVVRITPCSDAGGPNNVWWVETLVVLVPEPGSERENQALDCCGWIENGAYEKAKGRVKKAMLVEACLSYGYYDPATCMSFPWSEMVQIGKEQEGGSPREGPFNPHKVLPGNSLIRNYALRRTKEL